MPGVETYLSSGGGPYFRKKCLDHQVHAADVEIHGEVPVFLLAVQDGSVMDKTGRANDQWGKMIIQDLYSISLPFFIVIH